MVKKLTTALEKVPTVKILPHSDAIPHFLIEFDKTNAQILETVPFADFPLTSAFAFAFWGGDFYFFTEGNVPYSKVTKLDYDGDKQLSVVNPMAPIRIVGAGVSTCAPVLPPV